MTVALTTWTTSKMPLVPGHRAHITRHPLEQMLGVAEHLPVQGSAGPALVARAQPARAAHVAPAARRVLLALGARLVLLAQVRYARCAVAVILGLVAGVLASCPIHALAVREGDQISITVYAHVLVVAPHADGGGAVGAVLVVGACLVALLVGLALVPATARRLLFRCVQI